MVSRKARKGRKARIWPRIALMAANRKAEGDSRKARKGREEKHRGDGVKTRERRGEENARNVITVQVNELAAR